MERCDLTVEDPVVALLPNHSGDRGDDCVQRFSLLTRDECVGGALLQAAGCSPNPERKSDQNWAVIAHPTSGRRHSSLGSAGPDTAGGLLSSSVF